MARGLPVSYLLRELTGLVGESASIVRRMEPEHGRSTCSELE
ncbi:hypothetical protein [Caldivirga sp.]